MLRALALRGGGAIEQNGSQPIASWAATAPAARPATAAYPGRMLSPKSKAAAAVRSPQRSPTQLRPFQGLNLTEQQPAGACAGWMGRSLLADSEPRLAGLGGSSPLPSRRGSSTSTRALPALATALPYALAAATGLVGLYAWCGPVRRCVMRPA